MLCGSDVVIADEGYCVGSKMKRGRLARGILTGEGLLTISQTGLFFLVFPEVRFMMSNR